MAIFSRRTLQRLIKENTSFLSPKQTKSHVERLNQGDLGAEWEVLLLNVFSQLGKVEHERDFNGRKPDIYFTKPKGLEDFLADIKTVSDEGIELKNPYDQFLRRFDEKVSASGLTGHWNCRVGGDYEEASRTGKMIQLRLPPLFRFDTEIFDDEFAGFLLRINASPKASHQLSIKTDSTDLEITYKPHEENLITGGYPNYKTITERSHLIQNSIYNGLVEKGYQLKESGYDGMKGIILCDGGSDFLKRSRNIIDEFLRSHSHIDFVLAFDVEQPHGSGYLKINIYLEKGSNIRPELESFLDRLHESVNLFPYAKKTAKNAQGANRTVTKRIGHKGGTVKGKEILLSVRTATDILAGRIPKDEIPEWQVRFFERMKSEGRLIVKVELIDGEDEKDDDYLTLHFGAPDPAIAPFRVPSTNVE